MKDRVKGQSTSLTLTQYGGAVKGFLEGALEISINLVVW